MKEEDQLDFAYSQACRARTLTAVAHIVMCGKLLIPFMPRYDQDTLRYVPQHRANV